MADYLVYWKIFWDEHPEGLTDPDFLWHTGHQYWNNVQPGDTLWAVASGGIKEPSEWRLVERLVVQEKYSRPDFERPNGIRGNPALSEAYQIDGQQDLTPLLHELEFTSGRRLTVSGREIGKAIQVARPLTENDRERLDTYARKLVRIGVDAAIVDELLGITEEDFKPRRTSNGAGFGNPETNRKVEKAAIKAVTEWYENEGWTVQSKEADKCGYDLLCKRGLEEKHVEVKGVQGSLVAFIITANERGKAKDDTNFVLCVVTSVLSQYPKLNFYDSTTFASDFVLSPLAYRAMLRT